MSFSNRGTMKALKKHVGNPSHLELILWLGKVLALRQAKCWAHAHAHDGASCDGPTERLKLSPGSGCSGFSSHPLVNVYKKRWKTTIFHGKIHYKMESHHFIAGKIHYFDWAIFHVAMLVITRPGMTVPADDLTPVFRLY